jgi:NADH-quinone oxidoreductase subunit C
MEPLQVVEFLREEFSDHILKQEEFRGQMTLYVEKDKLIDICRYLKSEPSMAFNYLRDLTAVDWQAKKDSRYEVVYHLYSIKYKEMIRLKVTVDEKDMSVQSLVPVWAGANWHERECYDMFGITFTGHPDHRRILMPDDWEGFPLRKDYPVKGPDAEHEWIGFKEVLEKAERLKEFQWER